MSFAFPDIDPNTSGAITHVQVPLDRYLSESFAVGQHDTVLNSLSRISEFNVADDDLTSPILDTETANKKWGVGNLKFTEPVRESVARVMNRRKRDEMDREFFLSQGSSMGRFLPGMAASILGSVSNPLDLGLMFIPFVGEEAAAAKATSVVGRIAARRLITREALKEVFPAAPKLTESVINGMVGQSLFEVPNIVASAQDQANYGPKQAAFNVFAGGAFAAAMHGLGAAMAKLGRGTREEMAKQALNQMLRDETIKVHQYVSVDEAAILEKLKFDADAARTAAYDSINMDDIAAAVRHAYGEVVASPAVRMVDGSVHTGSSHEQITNDLYKKLGEAGYRLDEEGFVTDKGRFISREEAGKLVGLPDKGYNHLMHENDQLLTEQIATANPEQLGTAEFDRYNQLLEENPHMSKVDALRQIMDEREPRRNAYLMSRPEIQELVERERVKAIESFIEAERQKHEQTKQSRFDVMKQAEIDRQIVEGKILKPEEVQKAIPSEKFDGSADADLEFDINGLKQDLKLEEMGVNADNSGMIQDLVTGIDKMIKSLDHDPTKMSLPLADLLTLGIGRPVLKALLIAIKEGLLLTNDIVRAIDHAFKKTKGVKDTPELREALTRAINDDTAKPLFTHTIQSELAKPQPFNVKPDRFTPQVIAAKLKQLPAPEQVMLKMAGIDQFMAKYKPTEMIDRPAFEEFVRNAMIEPEIRPMLNLGAEENPNYIKQRLNKVGRYAPREAQHILETAGWKIGPDMAIVAEGKPLSGMDRRLPEQWNDWLKNREKIQNLSTDPNVLYGEFVSDNVSVPIPFEKMEKPRTIFLAAPQSFEVPSSHYTDVKFGKKTGKSKTIEELATFGADPFSFGVDPDSSVGRRTKIPQYSKSMLAWMETHIVTMPDGRRVLHIFEAQSDVRQGFSLDPDGHMGKVVANYIDSQGKYREKGFDTEKEAREFIDQKLKEYQEKVQPLINHTDEILMKAALQLAKREGLDGVVISDPRTAMLTQGHLGSMNQKSDGGWRDVAEWDEASRTWKPKEGFTQAVMDAAKNESMQLTYEPPSQAAGMTQAYGNKLPTILRKATGKEGEAVELGGRHYVLGDEIEETAPTLDNFENYKPFSEMFPGSDSPSGQFFPVKDLAPDKPFELFTPKQVEPPKPQLEAINAAVDCILKKVI